MPISSPTSSRRPLRSGAAIACGLAMAAGGTLATTASAATSAASSPAAASVVMKAKPNGPSKSLSASLGATPKGATNWKAVLKEQDRLHKIADKLYAAKGAGFAGIQVDAVKGRVTLHYVGALDARTAATVKAAKGSVRVAPAKFTEKRLVGLSHRLAKMGGITSVSPSVDGSGLQATVSASKRSLGARSISAFSKLGLKMTTTVGTPSVASRLNDSTPYWGGSRIKNSYGGQCTAGFAVWHAGASRMLSAGHCADQWQNIYDGNWDYMGYAYGVSKSTDRLLINVRASGRVFNGGIGSGEYTNAVVGAARSYVGDWICTSGSFSGTRCSIQVKATSVVINVGYLIYNTIRAENVYRQNAVAKGDSGGPVESVAWWDSTKVYAKGTNTAIDLGTLTACTGVATTCAWRMYYVDVVDSLSYYGASIITG